MSSWNPNQCVFCGLKPSKKVPEHILPVWAAKFSGRQKVPFFIPDFGGNLLPIYLNNFKIPACSDCNWDLSNFEGRAKTAMICAHEGCVGRDDIGILLDWMDKLRIIFWLYILSINKIHHKISPKFFVNKRVDLHDRYINIFRLPNPLEKGVTFLYGNDRAFSSVPSCFGIIIRDLVIISYSGAAAMLDYFGAISSEKIRQPYKEPLKMIMNRSFRLSSLDEMTRVPGLQAFTFADSATMRAPTRSIMVQTPGKPIFAANHYTKFFIPRKTMSRSTLFRLARISILELQMRAMRGFDYIDLSGSDSRDVQIAKKGIDNDINLELSALNLFSILQYQRRFPELLI